jgi:hypothetical protein
MYKNSLVEQCIKNREFDAKAKLPLKVSAQTQLVEKERWLHDAGKDDELQEWRSRPIALAHLSPHLVLNEGNRYGALWIEFATMNKKRQI